MYAPRRHTAGSGGGKRSCSSVGDVANAITVGRVLALFVVVYLLVTGGPTTAFWCAVALWFVIVGDGLDGWVARKFGETSQFGAIFDIVGDRIVENACWVVFAWLRLIPLWVPLLVLARGFLVDGLRSSSYEDGMTPFGENNMMRSKLTHWLTAGRFMRGFFGTAKCAAFVYLAGLHGWANLDPTGSIIEPIYKWQWFRALGWTCVWAAVALTVIRAIPVVVDATAYIRAKNAAPHQ
jgi:CDP-diacylglycerol--glycerol-3-phosphate 3-phosphatidyltransferase